MFLDGLIRVFRARWNETAGGRKRSGNGLLVDADQPQYESSHSHPQVAVASSGASALAESLQTPTCCSRSVTARSISTYEAVLAAARAIRMTSQEPEMRGRTRRTASRISLLMRFRVTALPIRLLTEKANRLCGSSPGSLLNTSQWLVLDEPDRLTSLIRLLLLRRFRCFSIVHTDNRLPQRLVFSESDVAIGDGSERLA